MPQSPYDPVAGILAKSPTLNKHRADAWDAFYESTDTNDLATRLGGIDLPDSVKADLWDLKATGKDPRRPATTEEFTPKGYQAQGASFADKLKDSAAFLGSEAKGFAKAAGRSAVGIGQMAIDAGMVPGQTSSFLNPAFQNPTLAKAHEALAAQNLPEQIGGYLETGAELANPVVEGGKLALTAARTGARALAPVASKAGELLDTAAHVPVIGGPLKPLNWGVKALNYVLDAAQSAKAAKAVPEAVEATPAKLKYAVDRLRYGAEPVPVVPAASVAAPAPPPRTSVPKPKPAKMAAKPAPAEPAAPPKRAYFLKPEAQIAREAAAKAERAATVTPSDFTDPSQYPATLQKYMDQPIGKVTKAQVQEIADGLISKGMTATDAMRAIANDHSLIPEMRGQLMTALGKLAAKGRETTAEAVKRAATKAPEVIAESDYRGMHTPPMKDSGAPLHDLTGAGTIYPDDVYSTQGQQYYGHGTAEDAATFRTVRAMRGKPDADVTIYRAVPKDAPETINRGDWVTINRDYAKTHGEGPLRGGYKIVSQKVKARDIFTNGDSIHEWGYDPQSPAKAPATRRAK